jgi:hypothetical protein
MLIILQSTVYFNVHFNARSMTIGMAIVCDNEK